MPKCEQPSDVGEQDWQPQTQFAIVFERPDVQERSSMPCRKIAMLPSKPRGGFSLIELLVVAAIVGVLIALLVPAIQRVRAAAARVQCALNIRQLMIAAQMASDVRGCMPPLCAPCSDPNQGPPLLYCFTPDDTPYGKHLYTIFTFLLPYLEQDNIYQQLSINEYAGGQYSQVIRLFICPMDPSLADGLNVTAHGGADQWAGSSYAGNNYVFGDPNQGITYGAAQIPASFPDGTSTTICFAEVFGTCGSSGDVNNLWGSLWADSNSIWRPGYDLGPDKAGNLVQGYPPAPLPQDSPNYITGCDPARPQSAHSGGLNVGLADGSVRICFHRYRSGDMGHRQRSA